MPRVIRRLGLLLGVLLISLLVAEGALSLADRSLRELLPGAGGPTGLRAGGGRSTPAHRAPAGADDARATQADGPQAGAIYALHDDPRVGYVFKPDSELAIFDGVIHTDHLGMRRRPGPPPPADALRLVVLGDSVAFGFGVGDEEALAARLEARLAELRGPGERPVACLTVAVPSWNHRAAAAFLLDHWDELRPDMVLYMPMANDVYDIDSTFPSGNRRPAPDPSSTDPWLMVSVRYLSTMLLERFVPPRGDLEREQQGADVVITDLCTESRLRLDANADTVATLHRQLQARGCRFAIVWHALTNYTWFLSARLQARAPGIPNLPLLRWARTEFLLPNDPHPNAETLDVWARWLAQELVDRGWVSRGTGGALPPAPKDYEELHLPGFPPPDDWERRAEQARAHERGLLVPEIDFRTGRGLLQIFGGLNPDLSARSRLLLVLRADGGAGELQLAPLAERPDLYPLAVAVELGGQPAGSVTVTADGPVTARLAVPSGVDRSQPLEVRLTPATFVVLGAPGPAQLGSLMVSSFRPLRAACVAD
jgi:hypothetical protein